MADFEKRLEQLRSDLVTQGERVLGLAGLAVESYFDRDVPKAVEVIDGDTVIDRADIEIERASIPLLGMGIDDEQSIRMVLTVVKINNDLERVADCAVNIAEVVQWYAEEMVETVPATFRVMANSVLGIIRDTTRAWAELDVGLATQVLQFDDTVDRFKAEIGLEAERKVASGEYSVSFGFRLRTVTAQLERMGDHCTNICEQIIYLKTGKIVRHIKGSWSEPQLPEG